MSLLMVLSLVLCAAVPVFAEDGEANWVKIPATGTPDTPDTPAGGVCPYCGETHNRRTISGWWTELIHHILFILNRIFFWWNA